MYIKIILILAQKNSIGYNNNNYNRLNISEEIFIP